ncbi:MAG: hypothetical protein AAFY72_14935, partial [Cyanobacteria bacterium J06649_4]
MATLHGNWLPDLQGFFLWGETWRKAEASHLSNLSGDEMPTPAEQPYQLTQAELAQQFDPQQFAQSSEEIDLSWMQEQVGAGISAKLRGAKAEAKAKSSKTVATGTKKTAKRKTKKDSNWQSRVVVLPTKFQDLELLPQLSTASTSPAESDSPENDTPENDASVSSLTLYPWEVSGGVLNAVTTIKFLSALPLGQSEASAFVGDDLRYWSHLTRWCLDLLARGKFLPVVSGDRKGAIASWQLLLDSATDQARLKDFCDRIPLICCSYPAPTPKKQSALKVDLPNSPA